MTESTHPGQIAGTSWSLGQYQKFGDARLRPALELLDRVDLEAPEVIYDLGCGSGEITRLIAARWPGAAATGVDNSAEMLEKAGKEPSRVEWLAADIRTWEPDAPPNLIYTNAALQWVENHNDLLPRLAGFLAPDGVLAIQMPLSWHAPTHRLMRETLANGGPNGTPIGTEALRESLASPWVADAPAYYDLLEPHVESIDIWETEYLQQLSGENPVLEWVKGTGLRPILHDLDDDERAIFLREYARRLQTAYPRRSDGTTLYPFRRLFIVATR